MSAKLDQSLDEILSTRKTPRGRGRGRRAPTSARTNGATAAAPVGGIQKTVRNTRGSARAAAPTGPTAGSGESKVIVSNLVGFTLGFSAFCHPTTFQPEVLIISFNLALRCERDAD